MLQSAYETLKSFIPSEQPTKRHTSAVRGSKLEFTKLKMKDAEWADYMNGWVSRERYGFRHLESLYAVESQIAHNAKQDGDEDNPVVKAKTRAGLIIGGVFAKNIQLPAVYLEEYQQYLSNLHGVSYTKEDVSDIVNEKLYKLVGAPMMNAFYEKMGADHIAMGDDYWRTEFLGGTADDTKEDTIEMLEKIKEYRGEKKTGKIKKQRTEVEEEQRVTIEEQRAEIEKLKEELVTEKKKKFKIKKKPKKKEDGSASAQ